MKKLLIFALAANCMSALAQSDPVLMTINGKDVTRSEFEYSYNKNNSDGVIDILMLKSKNKSRLISFLGEAVV